MKSTLIFLIFLNFSIEARREMRPRKWDKEVQRAAANAAYRRWLHENIIRY